MSSDLTLILIPARSGSKRLPGKNLRLFCGRPLIEWTIAQALSSHSREHVVVSTDSEEIAAVARAAGAQVPFLRPADLATDQACSVDVALHALDALGERHYATLLLLQPTSPLRSTTDITDALQQFRSLKPPALVGVTGAASAEHYVALHPFGTIVPLSGSEPIAKLNGAIYVIDVATLRNTRTFLPLGSLPFAMPLTRSIDIDVEADWQLAERLHGDS